MIELLKNDCLKTPFWVYSRLGRIDLDPCAGVETKIGRANFRLEDGNDGLFEKWSGFVFCNPPFSKKEMWIEKMKAYGAGILLLPERGSTPWHGPCAESCGYHFTMGKKINFEGGSSSNPTGSTLFLFGNEAKDRIISSGLPGTLNKVIKFTSR
jgi:hypothetical protein